MAPTTSATTASRVVFRSASDWAPPRIDLRRGHYRVEVIWQGLSGNLSGCFQQPIAHNLDSFY